jgi:two-component system response regulator NreC
MTTILLADNNALVRKHVRALLEQESDFYIIGEASDGLETIQTVERLQPDVLLLDLMMEGMSGIEVTRWVVNNFPKTGIVIYSIYSIKAYVVQVFEAGAKAYVLKGSDSNELVLAIRKVATGHMYLPKSLSKYSNEIKRLINQNNDSGI